MATTRPQGVVSKRLPGPRAVALAVSLAFSASLTAVALRGPDHRGLAWISFLPLFAAVRWLRPPLAATAGGLWGACLYLSCTAGPTPAIDASLLSLALLTAVPAVYTGLAARPAWAIGFNLLLLALGWTLLEAALRLHGHKPLALYQGLLPGVQSEPAHHHWLIRLLPRVSVAFPVAWANASVLVILSGVRLRFPRPRSFEWSPQSGICPLAQTVVLVRHLGPRQAQPRAPPIELRAMSRCLVDAALHGLPRVRKWRAISEEAPMAGPPETTSMRQLAGSTCREDGSHGGPYTTPTNANERNWS